jgi:hypothetical protein
MHRKRNEPRFIGANYLPCCMHVLSAGKTGILLISRMNKKNLTENVEVSIENVYECDIIPVKIVLNGTFIEEFRERQISATKYFNP